jgi:hypothetical protein
MARMSAANHLRRRWKIALVDVDAPDLDAGVPLDVGDGSVWPSKGLPCCALARRTNWPPLGCVTGTAIDTLQPNS